MGGTRSAVNSFGFSRTPHAALVRAEADETAIRHQAQTRAARRTHDRDALQAAVHADP